MPDRNPFENQKPEGVRCEEWEAWLAEMLDGERGEEPAFAAHGESCPSCSELLARARQGREWLQFLHEEPVLPEGLLGKILESTTGQASMALPVAGVPVLAGAQVWPAGMRRGFHETRMLMTVAMAFFSIALTLNLLGVRPDKVRLQDLSLSSIQSSLVRGFYGTKEQVVHTYDNLRFVYQMESRLRELRRDTQQGTAPKQNKTGGQLNLPSVAPNSPQWARSEQERRAAQAERAAGTKPESGLTGQLIGQEDQAERSLV
jgi:hypothetical protein